MGERTQAALSAVFFAGEEIDIAGDAVFGALAEYLVVNSLIKFHHREHGGTQRYVFLDLPQAAFCISPVETVFLSLAARRCK
jgi:hypothetical protein